MSVAPSPSCPTRRLLAGLLGASVVAGAASTACAAPRGVPAKPAAPREIIETPEGFVIVGRANGAPGEAPIPVPAEPAIEQPAIEQPVVAAPVSQAPAISVGSNIRIDASLLSLPAIPLMPSLDKETTDADPQL
jgi:hypothetical protein